MKGGGGQFHAATSPLSCLRGPGHVEGASVRQGERDVRTVGRSSSDRDTIGSVSARVALSSLATLGALRAVGAGIALVALVALRALQRREPVRLSPLKAISNSDVVSARTIGTIGTVRTGCARVTLVALRTLGSLS